MPNNQQFHRSFPNFIEAPLFRELILKKTNHQRLGSFYKKVWKSLNETVDANEICDDAQWRLQHLTLHYQNKLTKENTANVELQSTYYLKALKFLNDFQSEQTENLSIDIRQQVETFIYTALYESMDSCEDSPSFKMLFKQTEGLEFDLWVTERLAQIFLKMQEYLSKAHGISINVDNLPGDENELFISVKAQVSTKLMDIDMVALTIPFNKAEEETILNWSINGCNSRLRKGYFRHAFKLGIFINTQSEDIAYGMGLSRLGNLFTADAIMLKLAYKDAGDKEEVENEVSCLKLNVGDKKEDIQYWTRMAKRVQDVFYKLDGSNYASLEKIESEWFQKLVAAPDGSLPPVIVNAFCRLLNFHKKLKLRQAKRFEVEGNFIAFPNPNLDYKTLTEDELEAEINRVKKDNKTLKKELKVMESSQDALFQLIRQKSGNAPS